MCKYETKLPTNRHVTAVGLLCSCWNKVEEKFISVHTMKAYKGRGGEAYFHLFLTLSLDMSDQLQASAALPQAKEPLVHRNLNGSQPRSDSYVGSVGTRRCVSR